MNTATIVVGLIVAVMLVAMAYLAFRSMRRGGCSECRGCEQCKSKSTCTEDPEKKTK